MSDARCQMAGFNLTRGGAQACQMSDVRSGGSDTVLGSSSAPWTVIGVPWNVIGVPWDVMHCSRQTHGMSLESRGISLKSRGMSLEFRGMSLQVYHRFHDQGRELLIATLPATATHKWQARALHAPSRCTLGGLTVVCVRSNTP